MVNFYWLAENRVLVDDERVGYCCSMSEVGKREEGSVDLVG
jgi:hypothetical protein